MRRGEGMSERFTFNRMEFAGSLGDLGTLLPIAIALVVMNGINPMGVFVSVGIYYILSGCYFGVTVPVQPMKVIGAYAIATSMNSSQILSASLLMAIILLLIGITNGVEAIRKITPFSVVRGIQLSTGILLVVGGIQLILGTSLFQTVNKLAEPYLLVQRVGPIPIGIIIGSIGAFITLFLLNSRRLPAGLVIVVGGVLVGYLLGARLGLSGIALGMHLPEWFPFPFPEQIDFSFAFFALVLPQLPMTMGNAVFAYTDLSKKYFGEKSSKVSNRAVCISMALANFLSYSLGGMPLCHGAGGLAAHYRFGARTAGSNLIIGTIFLVLAFFFGNHIIQIIKLIPMSILGILLLFAGLQLALTVIDLQQKKDYFIAFLILGITLASNMASGFIIGIAAAYLLKWDKLSI